MPAMTMWMWLWSISYSKCRWPRNPTAVLKFISTSACRPCSIWAAFSQWPSAADIVLFCFFPGWHGPLWWLTLTWKCWWPCWMCLRLYGSLGCLHPIISPSLHTGFRLALQPDGSYSLIRLPPNYPSCMHFPWRNPCLLHHRRPWLSKAYSIFCETFPYW